LSPAHEIATVGNGGGKEKKGGKEGGNQLVGEREFRRQIDDILMIDDFTHSVLICLHGHGRGRNRKKEKEGEGRGGTLFKGGRCRNTNAANPCLDDFHPIEPSGEEEEGGREKRKEKKEGRKRSICAKGKAAPVHP